MALSERGRIIDLAESRPQPISLRDNLLPEALDFYDKLGPELQQQHARMLNGIERMGILKNQNFVIPENFTETNLMHVYEANEMALEYHQKYPTLRGVISFPEVQSMLSHHDDGEGVVGDVQPLNRTPEDERRKRLEPRAATRYVFSHIADPEVRNEVVSQYKEYNENDPRNLEVQMARFIDKAQGTTRAAEKAFNINAHRGLGNEDTANKIRLHLWNTVPRMMEPALNLLTHLPEEEAREEMRGIVLDELSRLEEHGAPEVAKTFSSGVSA